MPAQPQRTLGRVRREVGVAVVVVLVVGALELAGELGLAQAGHRRGEPQRMVGRSERSNGRSGDHASYALFIGRYVRFD
jgi:hypothetical protein